MRKQFFYTLVLTIVICSCNNSKTDPTSTGDDPKEKKETGSKDDKDDKKEVSVSENDIIGIYTITAISAETEDGNEEDLSGNLSECDKKNTYGFNKDGVWYLGGVATQTCTGPDESGTWKLSGDQLTINSQQSGVINYTIEDYDGKNLEVSTESEVNGTRRILYTTFTKQ